VGSRYDFAGRGDNRQSPHGEERREAARLEHHKSAIADLCTHNADLRVNPGSVGRPSFETPAARAPQDEGGEESQRSAGPVFSGAGAPSSAPLARGQAFPSPRKIRGSGAPGRRTNLKSASAKTRRAHAGKFTQSAQTWWGARLSALHRGVFTPASGRAFRRGHSASSVSQLLAGVLSNPRRSPVAARARGYESHPRAPHPIPSFGTSPETPSVDRTRGI